MEFLQVHVDHFAIMGRSLEQLTSAMADLGFATGGQTTLKTENNESEQTKNCHYMFDNCYVEVIADSTDTDMSGRVHDQPGVHLIALASDNIQKDRDLLSGCVETVDVKVTHRHAAHGELTGEAYFAWVGITDPVPAETKVGVVQHMTPELIYQVGRIKHPNGVLSMKKLVLSEGSETTQLFKRISGVMSPASHCIDFVYAMTGHEFKSQFGRVPASSQSDVLGIVFDCEDIQKLEVMLRENGLPVEIYGDQVVVNMHEKLGLFVAFSQR